jgi:hypothetical protein
MPRRARPPAVEMKVFFSHASPDKPLVRAIARAMPPHVECWVDEGQLSLGYTLHDVIRRVIDHESHYFVVFPSAAARDSAWVHQELDWALAREAEARREFVLPLLLEEGLALDAAPPALRALLQRLYLPCYDASARGRRKAAEALAASLFACASRDLPMPAVPRQKLVDDLDADLATYRELAFELQASLADALPVLATEEAAHAQFVRAVTRYNDYWQRFGPILRELPPQVRTLFSRELAEVAVEFVRFVEEQVYHGAVYALNDVRQDLNDYDRLREQPAQLEAAEQRKAERLAAVRERLEELARRSLEFIGRLQRNL